MLEKTKKLTALATRYPDITLPRLPYPTKNPLIIDIETTGFSPKHAMIYAIGCIYQKKGEFLFHQLFADRPYEEDNLLVALERIIQANSIDLLVHFNGVYFDIPFLKERYLSACLPTSLGELPQLDFYLEWKKCKPYFELPNAKLKTIEQVLRLRRRDEKNGGELISYYQRYLQGESNLLPLLLLHNEDDLLATFLLGHFLPFLEEKELLHSLFPYFHAFPQVKREIQDKTLFFHNAALQDYLERSFDRRYFRPQLTELFLRRYPLHTAEFRHFFADPQSYYYLPLEDLAVHSSVACFVEPAFRKKATKKTAYTKKTDTFLELPPSALPFLKNEALFQIDFADKKRYLPLTAFEKYWKAFPLPSLRQ